MPDDEKRINVSAKAIHNTEGRYQAASELLDELIDTLIRDSANLQKLTGLSDSSIMWDFTTAFLMTKRNSEGMPAVMMTEVIAAAAITRLARMRQGEVYDMDEFERKVGDK